MVIESFLCGLLGREHGCSCRPLAGCHFLQVENAEGGDLGDGEEAVVGQLGDQVVGERQALQLAAGRQLGHLLQLGNLVVHEEDVLKVGQRVGQVQGDAADAVVGRDDGGQPVEVGEVAQFADLVVAEVHALEEVLSRLSGTRVAPMFSMAVILYPLRSSWRQFMGLVNWGDCWMSSAVIFISYNLLQAASHYSLPRFTMITVLTRTIYALAQHKPSLLVLTKELLTQHAKYQPWRNVRLVHAITMARYDPQLGDSAPERQEEEQIRQIIESLAGELHVLPHRQLNMLMEVLRERGFRYDRTLPLAKAVNKQAKLLLNRPFQASELCKTLALCKQLAMPKATWVKIVESYLQIGQERVKHQQNLRMNAGQFFRLAILALEEPYLHLPATKTLTQKLLKHNANNLDTLTSLYHICRVLPSSLRAKVDYQLARSNVRQILFNPYSQMEQPEGTPQEEPNADDHKEVLKEQLNQLAAEILKIFHASVDQVKLQEAIVKSMESDVEPLTKQAVLFASDILQLRPIISQYLRDNYAKLTPIEFLHLLRKSPSESVHSLLKAYYDQLGRHMSIQDKVYLHLESHRFFKTAIDPQFISSLISESSNLTYSEFMAISRLIAELPQSGKSQVSEWLAALKSKSG